MGKGGVIISSTISKDANKLICLIYKGYCKKRKNSISKEKAKFLGSNETIHNEFVPDWLIDDVDDTIGELSVNDFLDCLYADDHATHVYLTDKAIIYMQNKYKNGFANVVDFISKFIP